MIKLKDLIKENSNYDASEDFFERRENQLIELANALKNSKGQGKLKWTVIPAELLTKTWLIFGKYNKINTNDLDKIADKMLTNIARLKVSTEMMGHTPNDVRPELEDLGYTFTDDEWNEWMVDYFTDADGKPLISDYGLPKLERLYGKIFKSDSDEERLYAIDKALNIIHQRSDLASMFVQGGTKTLLKISSQGGYSSDG